MLFIILITVFAQEPVYIFDVYSTDPHFWITKDAYINPPLSFFQGQLLMGGPATFNMGGALMRNFELPPHYQLKIELELFRIDNWSSDFFQIILDGQEIFNEAIVLLIINSNYPQCYQIYYILIEVAHNSNFASIQMNGIDTNYHPDVLCNLLQESWGISFFTLYIYPCPAGCDFCDNSNCLQWKLYFWDQLTTNHIAFLYPFFESYDIPIYRTYFCDQLCQYIQHLPEHNQVMQKFRILIQIGQSLDYQIIINHQVYNTNSSFGYLQFDSLYEIVVPAFYHSSYQINIQILRIGGTQTSFHIKDFQLFIRLNTQTIDTPSSNCITKFDNICLECQIGWKLDQSTQICLPICGDQIIMGNEECDDGNDIPYDGCFNCQYQCDINCFYCKFGKCQECRPGFELNENNCIPICGDGQVIPYIEQCDDQNQEQGDGCYNCKYECTENEKQVLCIECSKGFKIQQNVCIPICGDKIILPDYEECDDGNDVNYDGCYQCKYQCQKNCQNCQQGICMDKCNYGEIMINNLCESVCGNGIITKYEECDDGNNIQYDGCYLCQYQCPLYCDYCEQGQCLECYENLKLINNTCLSYEICGTGLIGDKEECDDGNVLSNDGCSSDCKIEQNWICDEEEPSACFYYVGPQLILTYINQTIWTQFVLISFSQEIKIEYPLSQTISMEILDIAPDLQTLNLSVIKEAQTNLSYAQYVVSVQINTSLSEKPILSIKMNQIVSNQYDIPLKNQVAQIKLQIPSYLDPIQIERAQQLSGLNEKLIYLLAVVTIFSFLFGDSFIFSEILNILQYYSYLKYINLRYPENLQIFFETSDLVSFKPLFQYVPINQYFDVLSEQALKSKGKFEFYELNADLIQNITGQILQVLILLSLNLLILVLKKMFYNNSFIAKYLYYTSYLALKLKSNIVLTVSRFLYLFVKQLYRMSQIFTWEGLKSILLLNSWDLIFKSCLFLNSIQYVNLRDYIQLSLSLIFLIVYFIIIFVNLFQVKKTKKKNLFYSEALNVCRQVIFLILLVFAQFNQVFQTLSISFFNLFYLFITKRFSNFTSILIEGIIALFTLSCVAYFEEFRVYVDQERRVLFGLIHIGLLSLTLVVQIVSFILLYLKKLHEFLRQIIQSIKRKTMPAPESLFF